MLDEELLSSSHRCRRSEYIDFSKREANIPTGKDRACRISGRVYYCRKYTSSVEVCLKAFKFRKNMTLIPVIKKLIISSGIVDELKKERFDLIIPVPMHPCRKRKRGYNHSEIISRILSEMLNVPVSDKNLKKVINTPPQFGLSMERRRENLKGSFALSGSIPLAGKRILIVDDVMTTGATISELGRTAILSGISKISFFVIARVFIKSEWSFLSGLNGEY